ncbi:MAG TPA: isochorismatase family cysteine hydrolase [Burkholderiales bacterium]|nr:isochorismatase family cysteine hydrolase [Burkholderiales bacterium]
MEPAKNHDLHGSAPDRSPVALLLIDFINDFQFEGGQAMFDRALAAAQATATLRTRARRSGVPVVYCNDNFGRWRSDFRSQLEHCLRGSVRGRRIAELLRPDERDYFVLKPKHSGFHSTTLEVLLAYLGVRRLVLTGVAGNFCVLFTAHDAYMRDFDLLVPRDCIASQTADDDDYALRHLESVCKADTRPSVAIDFEALLRERPAPA